MPLLSDNLIPNPPEVNKEMILNRVVNRIKNISTEYYENSIRTQREGIRMVWEQQGITPQEIIDRLGEDAIKIFQFHGALTDFITSIAQADGVNVELKKPTNSFTVELSSGRIIVNDEPYQS